MSTDKLDFRYLASAVLSRVNEYLPSWLPGGKMYGREYCCASIRGGDGKSFKVNVGSGKWADFAAGDKGGDLISLYAAINGLSQFQAAKALAVEVGQRLPDPRDNIKSPESGPVFVKPPKGIAMPDFNHKEYGEPTIRYTYRDESGDVLFFVCRYDPADGKKQFIPHSYTSGGNWLRKMWPNPRPLFGLELLSTGFETGGGKSVLVVEGEKAAIAARILVGDNYDVVSWHGGVNAVDKADWSPVYNRRVLIWPDADEPGKSCALKLAGLLIDKVISVKILNVPESTIDGWDAADAVAGGWTWDKFRPWAKEIVSVFVGPRIEVERGITKAIAKIVKPPEIPATKVKAGGPTEFGFYELIEQKGGKITYQPMYNELANWCFNNKNICVTDKEQLLYDGKKWDWLERTELANFLMQWNKGHLQPCHHDNFIKQLRAACYMKALGINPDSAAGHLNVENGVVRISDGELLPHDYKFRFRFVSPIKYDKEAECPRWDQFLCDTFVKDDGKPCIELIDLAQRIFGYVLMGGRPFLHKAFVLYGSGRNGKSTFLDILRAIIGRDAYSVVGMSKLDKEFSLVSLEGKLANLVEETPNEAINAEVFKTLVGGGEVTVAHKGYDEYQLRCDARFVFACNEMPIFKDKSVGLEDRLVFMPFKRYIPEEQRDTLILDKLYAELPGILNWALFGAKIMINERMIPKYSVLEESKEHYKIDTNPLYAWFKEELIVSGDADGLPVDDVYKRYCRDTESNGNKPFSKDRFSKMIRKYIETECRVKGIFYDNKLKSKDRGTRLYCAVLFRVELSFSMDTSDSYEKKVSTQNYFNNL
jgi:P4 family phage/plasmid primase-like protien